MTKRSKRKARVRNGGVTVLGDNFPPATPLKQVAYVSIEDHIRESYPNGHPQFADLTIGELKLHSEKNHDYAAGGDPLGNFKRVATILALYPGLKLDDPAVVAFVYAMKQVDAYLWMKSNGHTAKVEGTGKRLEDVSVYSKLCRIIDENP